MRATVFFKDGHTDNEIIKAVERCMSISEGCDGCPFSNDSDCDKRLREKFLDLVYRKDTEIDILIRKKETLKDEISELRAEIERYEKTVGKLAVREDGTVVGITIGKDVEYISRDLAKTFRKLAVRYACEQFMKEFKKYIKDVGLTWGQIWDIDCALKRVFHELMERKEDEE